MNWATVKDFVAERRHQLSLIGLAIVVTAGLLLCNLAGATAGSSNREVNFAQQSTSLSDVIAEPQFVPLKLLHWAAGWISGSPLFWSRVPSVLFAAASVLALTYIIRRWYGQRTAIFGFAIVVCSAWLLHIGRLSTADAMFYWALPALIASHLLLYSKPMYGRLLFWVLCQSLLLYVPGMVWLILINLFWQRQELAEAWDDATTLLMRSTMVAVAIALSAPLGWSLLQLAGSSGLTASLLTLGGLPQQWPSVLSALSRLGDTLAFIFVRGQAPTDLWLNHLPLLDVFLAAGFLLGLYFYIRRWQAFRSLMLLTLAVVTLALLALGGSVRFSLFVPLIYLIVPAGLAYALHYWVKTFPVNPLAKNFGICLIGLAVAASCLYNLRSYFIAWPHNETTQSAFTNHNLPKSKL